MGALTTVQLQKPKGITLSYFQAFVALGAQPAAVVGSLGPRLGSLWIAYHSRVLSQVKLLLPKFHRNRTHRYYSSALFGGGCWVFLTGCFHRHSAAGWAKCTVAGPRRVRRHAAQFSERSSTPLIGHSRAALSGVLTRLPSTQTDDTQRGGKSHKLFPAP